MARDALRRTAHRMKTDVRLSSSGRIDVALVPYRRVHVPAYHTWMQSPSLQTATASEPLTLAEEYEMQARWTIDDDKCTFIVMAVDGDEEVMIGDVNLFIDWHHGSFGAQITVVYRIQ